MNFDVTLAKLKTKPRGWDYIWLILGHPWTSTFMFYHVMKERVRASHVTPYKAMWFTKLLSNHTIYSQKKHSLWSVWWKFPPDYFDFSITARFLPY